MSESWNQTSRVDIQKLFRLLVRINLYILIRNLLVLEGDPNPMNERTVLG
jgi:hypothetical protein